MHAALLLLTACTAGEPVIVADDGPDGSCVVEPHVKPTMRDRLRVCLKKQDCGPHIHCDYPGVIPNTEHSTLCQRLKERLFPNHAYFPAKPEAAPAPPAPIMPHAMYPVESQGGLLAQTVRRFRFGNGGERMFAQEGVAVDMTGVVSGSSESSEVMATQQQTTEQLMMPSKKTTLKPERLYGMPTPTTLPEVPVQFNPPRTLEIDPD